ncbi:MAG: diguanylate cyclase, partial [Acidobacteriia bacterium]|nr:diguanylate cyclase [Terriglobia bacterium]
SGYPNGLKGKEIPLGARILAAVDCLDAIASHRQYRRAMPLDDAMEFVVSESGRSFDPAVVAVLKRRYRELAGDQECEIQREKLETNLNIERGLAPAAGFQQSQSNQVENDPVADRLVFLSSIAAARQEAQVLFELSNDLGSSLSLPETLSVLDLRLKKTIPYHTMVVYVLKENCLVAEYAQGDNFQLFASLKIPAGEGLSGWVAQNTQPVINGNPAVEYGYLSDPRRFTILHSALAIPLNGPSGTIGVLALYHKQENAFSGDHLRVLTAVCSKIALVVQNALRFREVEKSATTDGLTGLPNATSLFLHLDSELSRCKRSGSPLAVLVCDLDGFKQVNDRFGHLEGNRLLKMVADALRACCREYDYVSRMGGDEFVIVLPGASTALLRQKLCTITRAVEQIGLEVCGEELVSISVGKASFPDQGMDAEELLAEADRSMYQAKQSRRHAAPKAADGLFDEVDNAA